MAILSREEFFERINGRVADDSSDDAIKFVEDMSDTYNSLADRAESDTDWERRYRENDEAWRRKYRSRFFRGDAEIIADTTVNDEPEIRPEEVTFEDLFE